MELALKGFTGRISDNDLRLLRTFCTVVEHGGFVPAESELQIGLPSISRYIKDLEVRLGLRLCDRGRRGFTLTAEGKQVHEACLALFDNLSDFEHRLRRIHASPAGALRIGMVDSLGSDPHFRLPDAVRAYKRAFPNIGFKITTDTSNRIEQQVIEGELDIGLMFERRQMEQLTYHLLYHEISYLYCSADHPLWSDHRGQVAGADLSAYEIASYPMAQLMEKMGVSGLLNRTATADHMEAIAMLVHSDAYLGFLPERFVDTLWCGGRFRKVAPEQFKVDSRISAVTRSGPVSPVISAFVDSLVPQLEPA